MGFNYFTFLYLKLKKQLNKQIWLKGVHPIKP